MIAYVPKTACRQGQWTMIGLLLTIAIIVILAAAYYPHIAAEHSKPGEARTPKERAYGAGCEIYTAQINQAVTMYKTDHDDHAPSDLSELKKYGVTDEMINAKGCSFQIDSTTGLVSDTGQGRTQPEPASIPSHYGRHTHSSAGGQGANAASPQPAPYTGYAPQLPYGAAPQSPAPVGYTPPASSPDDNTTAPASPPVHINIPNVSGGGF